MAFPGLEVGGNGRVTVWCTPTVKHMTPPGGPEEQESPAESRAEDAQCPQALRVRGVNDMSIIRVADWSCQKVDRKRWRYVLCWTGGLIAWHTL